MKAVVYPSMVALFAGFCFMLGNQAPSQARKDQELRKHLSDKQIDKMVEDSFPASDPPSTY